MRSAPLLVTVTGVLALCGCAPKVLILQTPVISMTKSNSGDVSSFNEGKSVNESWCSDDDPIRVNDDGSKHYGMIDQVVLKAHKRTKADFFVNNRFYQQGTCVLMSANVGQAGSGESGKSTDKSKTSNGHKKKRKKG